MTIQEIRREFFTYRNGMLADSLRFHGDPHEVIFGLEVPRLAEIARKVEPSMELASQLWADRESREARMLASYLFPVAEVDMEKAVVLASDVRTQEEADMLAFRLFKRLPYAAELLERFRREPKCAKAATALAAHLS